MKLRDSLFYAKILLFGEYGIIEDSMGLSIPYNFYQGKLVKGNLDNEYRERSNQSLKTFFNYLKALSENGKLLGNIDLRAMENDLGHGLHFDSNIPQGFGVGSSGALVAAVYSMYSTEHVPAEVIQGKEGWLRLKAVFAQMESHFHGKSSGIDPLICYLNIPLLIRSKSDIGTVGMPPSSDGKGAIFLIDSGTPGETQPLVSLFMEKCKQEGFRKLIRDQFTAYNNDCIKAFLKKDLNGLFENLRHLSQFLFEHFKPMIPSVFQGLWKDGLESKSYYLKLCGSGGGGFVLGFTENLETARKALKGYELEVIHRF